MHSKFTKKCTILSIMGALHGSSCYMASSIGTPVRKYVLRQFSSCVMHACAVDNIVKIFMEYFMYKIRYANAIVGYSYIY